MAYSGFPSSAFCYGMTDSESRWERATLLFQELVEVTGMTDSEQKRLIAIESLSFDYALSPDANIDDRYRARTLDQREDFAFKSGCYVVDEIRRALGDSNG